MVHARAGDSLLVDPMPVVLVTLDCELLFAGSSLNGPAGQIEAVAAAELAAQTAGARLLIRSASAALVRYYPSVAAFSPASERCEG